MCQKDMSSGPQTLNQAPQACWGGDMTTGQENIKAQGIGYALKDSAAEPAPSVEALIQKIMGLERDCARLRPIVKMYEETRNELNNCQTRLKNALKARALELL